MTLLGGEAFTGRMDAFQLTLEEGGGSGPYPVIHTGSEFMFVLGGQIHCDVDEQHFVMRTGDSILFDASLSHTWFNPGPGVSMAIILATEFEDDERPGEYHLAAIKGAADLR